VRGPCYRRSICAELKSRGVRLRYRDNGPIYGPKYEFYNLYVKFYVLQYQGHKHST
jgi:hypothetical protein